MANNLTPKEEFLLNPVTEHNITDAAIATFETNFRHGVKVEIPFAPVQEGTGDPSPDNIRPISGWTGCKIGYTENNLLQNTGVSKTENGITWTVNSDGSIHAVGHSTAYSLFEVNWFQFEADKSYILSGCPPEGAQLSKWQIQVLTGPTVAASYIDSGTGVKIKNVSRNLLIRCVVRNNNTVDFTFRPAIRAISEIPINWQSEAGTVYSGTVTLNEDGSADVVATSWILREMNTFSLISPPSSQSGIYAHSFNLKNWTTTWDKVGGENNMLCDVAAVERLASNYHIWGVPSTSDMYVYDDTISTVEEFKSKYAGHYILYGGKEANVSYHFPNVGKLKAFLGTNNIWADIGNVNVKYLTQNSETGMEYRGDRALELRRRAMIADAPTIHTTTGSEETGGLASFKSYVKAPVKKIEIPFKPKQDLHGYDHPWPAGGGENLLKLEDQEITKYTEITLEHPVPVSNGYYTLSVETTTTDTDTGLTSIVFIASSGYNYAFSQLTTGERTSKTVQFTRGDDTFVKIRLYASSGGASQGEGDVATFKNIKLEAGEVATPYSNICPIEGYDGCNVYHSNENLLSKHIEYAPSPIVGVSFVDDGNGKITFGGQTSTAAAFSKLSSYQDFKDYGIAIPPGTYKFSGLNATGVSVQLVYIGLHDTDLSKNGGFIINNQTPVNTVTFTEAKLCLTRFIINANVAVTGTFLPVLSIAEPSGDMVSALTTLPISWQTEAGTIYGGTVTIYDDGSADVEVHMSAPWVMTPSVRETVWRRNGTSNFWYNQDINVNGAIPFSGSGPHNGADLTKCVCNLGACSDNLTVSTLVSKSGYGYAAINTVLLGNTADVSPHAKYTELQSSNTPIKISLYYDTPIETYHFSNLEELKVWLGENNFWCDISDDISVKYWNRGFSN